MRASVALLCTRGPCALESLTVFEDAALPGIRILKKGLILSGAAIVGVRGATGGAAGRWAVPGGPRSLGDAL